MATKLSRVITYRRKTTPTKSRDPLITWSRDKCKSRRETVEEEERDNREETIELNQ